MTEQRYLDDSYVKEFEATVERSLDDRLVLDGTHFYPEGGGQPNDTGFITANGDRWRVTDVQKKDTIYHTVKPENGAVANDAQLGGDAGLDLPEPGTTVTGELQWNRRYAHMQYHTAQHLLSAILLEEFDARTTGNQLYDDHAHLDAEYDRFSDEDLQRIEDRLNELVADARDVDHYTMDREEAEAELDTDRTRIDLLPDSITQLRIVEIAGTDEIDEPYDRTACAGTHVSNTEKIGEVVVTGRETKGSDEERIEFTLDAHRED
ncbi:MAG: alanyl-tRNA editing protein [Halopenitus sp.]